MTEAERRATEYADQFLYPDEYRDDIETFLAGFKAGQASEKVMKLVEALSEIGKHWDNNNGLVAYYESVARRAIAAFNAEKKE